jgi:hypothetical protein
MHFFGIFTEAHGLHLCKKLRQAKGNLCFVSSILLRFRTIIQRNQAHGAPPSSPLNCLLIVPVGVMITGSLNIDCGEMF